MMKERFGLLLAAGAAGILGLCLVMTGCGGDGDEDTDEDVVTTEETTTSTIDTTSTSTIETSTTTTSTTSINFDTPFVSGYTARKVDGYSGIYTFVERMDVRLTANDASKIAGAVNGAYNLQPSLVAETGAFSYQGNVFTAKSFVSPRTLMKYRWMGWAVKRSSAPLTLENPLTLPELSGTLRCYWATVQ